MNRRERAVVLLLTVTFLVGAGIGWYQRHRRAQTAARAPITVSADRLEPGRVVPFTPSWLGVSGSVTPALLDLNRATSRQVEALPGIGPVLAARIIGHRQRNGAFRNVEELREVTGIGPKRYAALKGLVFVGSANGERDSSR